MTVQKPDPVVEKLESLVDALALATRRYPLLVQTAKELDELAATLSNRSASEVPIRNDALLQLLRDSFDMLVIDLASIRKCLTEANGVLNELKAQPDRLRRAAPEEFLGPPNQDHLHPPWLGELERNLVAAGINDAIERLVPAENPVTADGIARLIRRFRDSTEPVDKDRNHVRAQRYEFRNFDRLRSFQPLDGLEAQLGIFRQTLTDLYLVVTRNSRDAGVRFESSLKRTAEDLADLLLHGDINAAVNAYGVVEQTEANPIPWYYARRMRYRDEKA